MSCTFGITENSTYRHLTNKKIDRCTTESGVDEDIIYRATKYGNGGCLFGAATFQMFPDTKCKKIIQGSNASGFVRNTENWRKTSKGV